MSNNKFFSIAFIVLSWKFSVAQYAAYQENKIQICHYTCMDRNSHIDVYQYQAPKDCLSYFCNTKDCSNYFDNIIIGYDIQKDSVSLSIASFSNRLYHVLATKSERNLDSLCLCEYDSLSLGGDTTLLTIYMPLEDVEAYYVPTFIKKSKGKASHPLKPTIYAHLRTKNLSRLQLVKSKCFWECKLPLKDNSLFLYVKHKDYRVSELIRITVP